MRVRAKCVGVWGDALIRRATRATFSAGEKEERALDLRAIGTSPILPAPFGHIFLRLTHCQGLDKDSHKDSYRSDSGVKAAVRV